MSELDNLPDPVREAIKRCDMDIRIDGAFTACSVFRCDAFHYRAIRAELLRLSRRVAELEAENAGLRDENDMFGRKADEYWHDLAALRGKIAESVVAEARWSPNHDMLCFEGEDIGRSVGEELSGAKVCLLDLAEIRALLDAKDKPE